MHLGCSCTTARAPGRFLTPQHLHQSKQGEPRAGHGHLQSKAGAARGREDENGENPQFAPRWALLPICVPMNLKILPVNTSPCPFQAPKEPLGEAFAAFFLAQSLVAALLLFQGLGFFFPFFTFVLCERRCVSIWHQAYSPPNISP